jgi:hypothetical protein
MSKIYLALCSLLSIGVQTPVRAQDANRAVVMAPTDLPSVVDRVARRSGDFKQEFDKEVGHTMDARHMEERARHRADDVHDAARKLRDVFGEKKDKNEPAVRDQVDRVLASGSELSKVMQDHRFTDKLQRNWVLLRGDLNALASVYNLTPLD